MVADAKLLKQTDKITGKQRIAPRQKKTLFIPGRIIHITRLKPIKKFVHWCNVLLVLDITGLSAL